MFGYVHAADCHGDVCMFLSGVAELGDSASVDTTITQVVDQFNRLVAAARVSALSVWNALHLDTRNSPSTLWGMKTHHFLS